MLTKNNFSYKIKEKGEEKLQREGIEENAIKHHVTKDEVRESLDIYLGPRHLKALESMNKDTLELFESVLPTIEQTAYFVKGGERVLRQFRAYFIARCFKERYEYASFMLKDYVYGLMNETEDEIFMSSCDKELLFLYLHGAVSGLGKTDDWMFSTAIDKMVNRKRKGSITVFLSERDVPAIEALNEVIKIDLGGAQRARRAEDVLSSPIQDDGSSTVVYD